MPRNYRKYPKNILDPLYKTPADMQVKFDSYFDDCQKNDMVPNIIGMALHLGFSRQAFDDYSNKDKKFLHIIKNAKDKCYAIKFDAAIKGKLNPTIFIFDAVNNHDMFNTRAENKTALTGANGGPISGKWVIEVVNVESVKKLTHDE